MEPELRAPIRQTLRGYQYTLLVGLFVAVGLALWGGGGIIPTYLSSAIAVSGVVVAAMAWLILRTLQRIRHGEAVLSWTARLAVVSILQLLSIPLGHAVDRIEVARGKAWCEQASEEFAASGDTAERRPARGRRPRIVDGMPGAGECWVIDRSEWSAWWSYDTSTNEWTHVNW